MISREEYLARYRVEASAKEWRIIFVKGKYPNAVPFEVNERLYQKLQAKPEKSATLKENLEIIEDVLDVLDQHKQ